MRSIHGGGDDGIGFLAFGLLSLGVAAVKGELKAPRSRPAKFPSHPRSAAVLAETWRPSTLATVQLQAREAGERHKQPIDQTRLDEVKHINDYIHDPANRPPGRETWNAEKTKEFNEFHDWISARFDHPHEQSKSSLAPDTALSQPASSPQPASSEQGTAAPSPQGDESTVC